MPRKKPQPRKRPSKSEKKSWPKPELSRQGRINSKHGIDIIAKLQGKRMGGVNVLKTYKDRAWLAGLWVREKYRNRGYAKQIVQMAVQACKGRVKYLQGLAAGPEIIAVLKSTGFEFITPNKALVESMKKRGIDVGHDTKFMRLDIDKHFAKKRT